MTGDHVLMVTCLSTIFVALVFVKAHKSKLR
ncbi:hypothetical protein HDF16_004654 [Granulicella aggregans]|uniref:Uncharacterized protein n=1 Tax=Granulicella aggregans TaxID=474949 RepID=A0A7W7ZHB5_9BACT|nr:hypothetical protein [Granulicella aggregans]